MPEALRAHGAARAQPLVLALQPETDCARRRRVATRACVPNQRAGVDTCHQIQRVEELLRASGQIMAVEQIHDGARQRRHLDLQPQAIDQHHAVRLPRVRPGEASRWPDEAAGKAVGLEHAWLSGGDDLHVVPFGIGVAVQLQGRVIGDYAPCAHPGGRQEAVNRPCTRVCVLGHGCEHRAGDASDVARLEMLGEHRGDDLVARLAANGGSVFGSAENRVRTEEGRRFEPGHGNLAGTWSKSSITIYEIVLGPSMARRPAHRPVSHSRPHTKHQ